MADTVSTALFVYSFRRLYAYKYYLQHKPFVKGSVSGIFRQLASRLALIEFVDYIQSNTILFGEPVNRMVDFLLTEDTVKQIAQSFGFEPETIPLFKTTCDSYKLNRCEFTDHHHRCLCYEPPEEALPIENSEPPFDLDVLVDEDEKPIAQPASQPVVQPVAQPVGDVFAIHFVDAVCRAVNGINVSDFATIVRQLGLPMKNADVFQWLHDHDYLAFDSHNCHVPTEKASIDRLIYLRMITYTDGKGKTHTVYTPKLSGKGMIQIAKEMVSG